MEIEVTNNEEKRIDLFLSEKLNISRTKVNKMIKDKEVLVNEKEISPSYKIKEKDIIKYNLELEEEIDLKPEKMDLDIVYEDDYLAVINKQSGLVTHPAPGNPNNTLANGLMYHFNNISNKNTIRPGIVHRLDKDTSGLMVVAKTDKTHELLSNMIKERKVERKYIALVWGVVRHEKGKIDAPIGRDYENRQKYMVTDLNSKEAVTNFRVIKRYKEVTLIECRLETGRTHQIRVHMDYIGYPIVNDPVYGKRKKINDFGQMLHSKSIKFIHPITNKEIYFEKEPPEEFNNILKKFEE